MKDFATLSEKYTIPHQVIIWLYGMLYGMGELMQVSHTSIQNFDNSQPPKFYIVNMAQFFVFKTEFLVIPFDLLASTAALLNHGRPMHFWLRQRT